MGKSTKLVSAFLAKLRGQSQLSGGWALCGLLIFLMGLDLSLPLQPPSPRPAKAGQDKQNLSTAQPDDRTGDNRPAKPVSTATDGSGSQPVGRKEKSESDGQNQDSPYGWLTMAAAVVAAIATSVYAYFAARQWQVMAMQAHYMRDGLALTQQAANAATKSAEAASQAIEHMRLEQRAWLGLTATIGAPVAGGTTEIAIVVKNTGKTPGTIVLTRAGIYSGQIPISYDLTLVMHLNISRKIARAMVIAPDSTTRMICEPSLILSEADATAVAQGTKTVVVIASVEYLDVMGRAHATQCYMHYNSPSKSLYAYDRHNYMN